MRNSELYLLLILVMKHPNSLGGFYTKNQAKLAYMGFVPIFVYTFIRD